MEILRAEVDAAGYDVVATVRETTRHIQLKAMVVGGSARSWPIGLALSKKASGCMTCAPIQLWGAMVTFGAIASGFVGTSLSILTSLGTPVMSTLRESGYVRTLRNYLGWALSSGIMLSGASLAGMFQAIAMAPWFSIAWCGALVFCVGCLYRLATVMLFVFTDPDNA